MGDHLQETLFSLFLPASSVWFCAPASDAPPSTTFLFLLHQAQDKLCNWNIAKEAWEGIARDRAAPTFIQELAITDKMLVDKNDVLTSAPEVIP